MPKIVKKEFIEGNLVNFNIISNDSYLPMVIEAAQPEIDLASWLKLNINSIETCLYRYGGILFRGFEVDNLSEFNRVAVSLGNNLIEYDFASTPRNTVSGNIYTSTQYPAHQEIILHNEMAYSKKFPKRIWFYCDTVAHEGGETPIADSRKIYRGVDSNIRDMFRERGLLYIRNYHEYIDLSWQKVFQTTHKSDVEKYCNNHNIRFKWKTENHLQTSEACEAILTHPVTGEDVWFNQAHLFHISNLDSSVKEYLLSEFGLQGMPRNVYWGNGDEIDSTLIDQVRAILHQEKIVFKWENKDVLLLDNMLTAHGRNSYKGDRKILVAMTS